MASAIRFTIGADGKAFAMTIELRNELGLGTLKRTGE
jgi:hypothetical protein